MSFLWFPEYHCFHLIISGLISRESSVKDNLYLYKLKNLESFSAKAIVEKMSYMSFSVRPARL